MLRPPREMFINVLSLAVLRLMRDSAFACSSHQVLMLLLCAR